MERPGRFDQYGPHVCPDCHGMGWMRYDVPYGHPKFGQLVKCERPHRRPGPYAPVRFVEDTEQERIVEEAR